MSLVTGETNLTKTPPFTSRDGPHEQMNGEGVSEPAGAAHLNGWLRDAPPTAPLRGGTVEIGIALEPC